MGEKTISDLKALYDVMLPEYSTVFRRAIKIDATDRGKIWEAVAAKYPKYQILPDTNHVSYIKNNILASIYTVGKSARLLPTSAQDKQIVEQLNLVLENIWSTLGVSRYQMQAGERAALLNYGITQVGWDNNITVGTGDAFYKGKVILKNIEPTKFMRDPFATSLDTAGYCVTWDSFHKAVLMDNPLYKDTFSAYLAEHANSVDMTAAPALNTDKLVRTTSTKKNYYTLYTYFVNDNGRIDEYHVVNNECILYSKKNIKPSVFPFAELYCNLPSGDLFGTSECAKIMSNSISYNIMLSIILTAEHKNQRPPRFINSTSMINLDSFIKHGNDADHTFVVNGDASKAVSYHQFPEPTMQSVQAMSILSTDIKSVTGVDDRYTGRDTGSVLTTGGIESMLDQVTMIDAPKVENYEAYCKQLTRLVISNYICNGSHKRNYFIQDKRDPKKWDSVTVDFPKIDNDTVFDYEMCISSELPKNKSRIEAVANHLMEMQMQYQGQGINVDLITPEEWLMMQDLPMREYMQERMGIQRTQNYLDLVSHAVTEYSGLVKAGMQPEQAVQLTADTLAKQSVPGGERAVEQQATQLQNGQMSLT